MQRSGLQIPGRPAPVMLVAVGSCTISRACADRAQMEFVHRVRSAGALSAGKRKCRWLQTPPARQSTRHTPAERQECSASTQFRERKLGVRLRPDVTRPLDRRSDFRHEAGSWHGIRQRHAATDTGKKGARRLPDLAPSVFLPDRARHAGRMPHSPWPGRSAFRCPRDAVAVRADCAFNDLAGAVGLG